MADSTRLQLPLIAAAQAQKHVTHNEAILRLDGLVQMTAISYTTSAEPASPADGDLYLLPAGKTGTDWGAYTNHAIAHYFDGIWHQYHPGTGWLCFVQDTGILYYYTGSAWAAVPATGIADGTVGAPGLPFSSDTDTGLYRIGANNPALAANGAKIVDWKTTGINLPLQPCFMALLNSSSANATGDSTDYTLAGLTEIFDQGGNFNPTTGVFTAPVSGRYLLVGSITCADLTTSNEASIYFATSNRVFYAFYQKCNPAGGYQRFPGSIIADMDAGDTAALHAIISGGTKIVDIYSGGVGNWDSGLAGYLLA